MEKDIKFLSHWDIVSNFVENFDKKIKLSKEDIGDDELVKLGKMITNDMKKTLSHNVTKNPLTMF